MNTLPPQPDDDVSRGQRVHPGGAGASLRELMDRMGHDSGRAALTYLHGSDARNQAIAGSLDKMAREELKERYSHQRKRRSQASVIAKVIWSLPA